MRKGADTNPALIGTDKQIVPPERCVLKLGHYYPSPPH
jgi:hypothetical protein